VQLVDASRLAHQLGRLAAASDVAAVVLRLDSPGGSALGSDTLHHAITELRAAGKKVVVSCGNVTASGGVFAAVRCGT
jgi:protease IV